MFLAAWVAQGTKLTKNGGESQCCFGRARIVFAETLVRDSRCHGGCRSGNGGCARATDPLRLGM
ncbi:hypothetical protein B0T12DRAFT_421898, partial [Alternaria alternata]